MQDDDGRLVEAIARELATADGYYPDETEKSDPAYHPLTPAGWRRWHDYRDGARSALVAIEREGWKVVPVEPTAEMGQAMYAAWDSFPVEDGVMGPQEAIAVYRAALSAAPKQGI